MVINKSNRLTGGGPKHGRYVTHKKGTPLCNLFVTMLKNMGIETESFGQGTGEMDVL